MADIDPFEDIERVFGLMSQQFGTELAGVATDVIDAGEELVVRADLPGYDEDDIDVTLSEGRELTIAASRDPDDVDGRYVRRERRDRSATRTVRLPEPVVAEETSATYEAGVLTVRLGKRTNDDEDGERIPVS